MVLAVSRPSSLVVNLRIGAGAVAQRLHVDPADVLMNERVRPALARLASRIDDPLIRDSATRIAIEPASHLEVVDIDGRSRLVRDAERLVDLPRAFRADGGGTAVEEVDVACARLSLLYTDDSYAIRSGYVWVPRSPLWATGGATVAFEEAFERARPVHEIVREHFARFGLTAELARLVADQTRRASAFLAIEAWILEAFLPAYAALERMVLAPSALAPDLLRRLAATAKAEERALGASFPLEAAGDPLTQALGFPEVLVAHRKVHVLEFSGRPAAPPTSYTWRCGSGFLVGRLLPELSFARVAAQLVGIVLRRLCEAQQRPIPEPEPPSLALLQRSIARRREELSLPENGSWFRGASRRIARVSPTQFRIECRAEPAALEIKRNATWLYALPEVWIGVTLDSDEPSRVPSPTLDRPISHPYVGSRGTTICHDPPVYAPGTPRPPDLFHHVEALLEAARVTLLRGMVENTSLPRLAPDSPDLESYRITRAEAISRGLPINQLDGAVV